MLDSASVTVGATSSPTGRARPSTTAIVKARPSAPGPDSSKRDRRALGAPRPLAHDEGHGALHAVDGQGRGTVPAAPGPVQRAAGILLVDPAVEGPYLHERRVRHVADGAPADDAPLVRRACPELGQPGVGHLDEFRPDLGPGPRPAHRDPALVHGREIVLHVRAERAVPLRGRLAHERAFDPDEVRELVLDVPTGALRQQAPLVRRQLAAHLRQRLPGLGEGRRGFQPPLLPTTVLTCAVVTHEGDSTPARPGSPPDHPPVVVNVPLRSSPVQGHHRPEELPWLTTRGTA